MKNSLIIRVMCVGIVISLVLAIGCNNKKCTAPIESSKFLMKDYFPLSEGDKWSWKIPGWIAKNEYVDGDLNLGEPYLDLNQNGVRDVNEIFQDLNANGEYDGPSDPWEPGFLYVDRNGNGKYDPPDGMWDEGEEFIDRDGDGIFGNTDTLTLNGILYLHDNSPILDCEYDCGGMYGHLCSASADAFSNDSLGFLWHGHWDNSDQPNVLNLNVKSITIAKASIQAGDSSVYEETSHSSENPSSVYTWISVFENVESVTTPAGIFPDCLKFRSTASGWDGNMHRYNGTSYQWYAKGVGLVKSEGPAEGEHWLLKSAKVGGTNYP